MQRDEVMPPIDLRPYSAWMRRNSAAAKPIASSQLDLAPRLVDLVADHRLEDAVLVRGVAPGEAALHAGMAVVGLAVLPGHHPHHRVALHLRLEGAADAAIGAGGDDGARRRARARRPTSPAASRSGRPARRRRRTRTPRRGSRRPPCPAETSAVEAAALDRQREGALHLVAGAHAARADDALGRVEGEIGVAVVLRHERGFASPSSPRPRVVGARRVAHLAQADGAGHVLQLAVAVGRAGQAVERWSEM